MLKITTDILKAESLRINLCGGFTREYIPEIQKVLAGNGTKAKKVALDLAEVTFVDRAGLEFLCRAKSKKIELENMSTYLKLWIDQETRDSSIVTESYQDLIFP